MSTAATCTNQHVPWLSLVGTDNDNNSEIVLQFGAEYQQHDNNGAERRPAPDWQALQTRARTILIMGEFGGNMDTYAPDFDEVMMQLALAIPSNRVLQTIQFQTLRLAELGHLLLAVTTAAASSSHHRRITLRFLYCTIELRAAKALKVMLQSNNCVLEELIFKCCTIDEPVALDIEAGLRGNKSLRTFEFITRDHDMNLNKGVVGMLNYCESIVKLVLTIRTHDVWDQFRAANHNKSLQSLSFWSTPINLSAMDAILMKCFTIASLQELSFHECTFTQGAFDLLTTTVSEHKILDTLHFDSITIETTIQDVSWKIPYLGSLQVKKLGWTGYGHFLACSQLLDDAATSPFIQCLELGSDNVCTVEGFEQVANFIRLPNRGRPFELSLHLYTIPLNVITEALSQNTSISSLVVDLAFSEPIVFAQHVRSMTGLLKLSIKVHRTTDFEAFFHALVQSLEHNTTLQSLGVIGVDPHHPVAKRYLPQIRYFLAINRVGRHSLMTAEAIPNGIWANVLAKTSEDGIHFALTEKPDIVPCR